MKTYVVGCGGTGSLLTPVLCMLIGKENVVLIDGDELEPKNLNRQLFDLGQVGQNKAMALAEKYGCDAISKWYSFGLMEHAKTDVLIVCLDNHPGRVSALQSCDYEGCSAIFAANETHSSESYFYRREWKGTPLDPRVRWPEMLTDHSGDPRAAEIGCTGEYQERNRQLVSANFLAGALAIHLYILWQQEVPKLSKETIPMLPYHFRANMTKLESIRICDTINSHDRVLYAVNFYIDVPAPVSGLKWFQNPLAVVRFISTAVVLSFNGIISRRSWTHV